tara:strand:+ start:665 stop:2353 length:1689 start_codon:yes stop_codon:yes gene_type:complete
MFRVKNSNVSVPYQSVKIPCRNGLVFNESTQIVWDIPRNVGMADLKNACIECDININGSDNAPALQLIKTHGASSLFNRVSIRSMGRLLEQLDNYNLMTNLKYTASQDKGTLNKRSLCEGCAPSYKIQDNPFTTQNKIIATGETVNNANDTWRYVDRKVQVPLHTGIFQNDKSTPLMALPLEVEIIVEKDLRALYADTNLCNDLACTALPGAPQTFIELTAVTLAKFGVVGAGNQMAPDAKLNYLSNLPFRVGQRVLVAGGTPGNIVNGGNFNIVSIIENGGLIRLDMGANVNTGASAGVTVSALNNGALMTDAPAAGGHACVAQTVQIEIKNPRLIIPKVMPPENMMKAIGASIMKGKYNFDIVSYTDYQSNIVGTTTNSTTIIPADLSRVKSLICVPVEQADLNRLDNIRAQQGRYCEADSYEFQINNRMVPSRLVSLERESHGEFVAGAGNYIGVPDFALGTCVGAVHTYEIEKALGDSGIDVRNLRFLGRTHGNVVDEGYWLVARTLGPYGTSENLMGVSAILYLNYSGNNVNLKLLHNYAVHIRTVAFGPSGVELRY